MTGTEWLVVLGAITAIAWVNWYFFVAGRAPATAAVAMPTAAGGGTGVAGAIAEVVIEVDGGYSPNAVRVKAGEPVRLVFDRKDDSSCSEEVVIPDFGVRTYLPTGQRTTIEITPKAVGKYGYTCGMSMLRGTIIAED
jgi:plastocyanin domain-containing protein